VESCHNAKSFGLSRQHHTAGTTEEEINAATGGMAFTGKHTGKQTMYFPGPPGLSRCQKKIFWTLTEQGNIR